MSSDKKILDQYDVSALSDEQKRYIYYADSVGQVKNGIFLECDFKDADKPAVSKFGGSVPYLPKEVGDNFIPICEDCNQQMEVLVQLYIPDLPPVVQRKFPVELQESLIVLFLCGDDLPIDSENILKYRIYSKEEIPNLKLEPVKTDNPYIQSAIFSKYIVQPVINSSGFPDITREFPDLDYWEVPQKLRNTKSLCYFDGFPEFVQFPEEPSVPATYIMNLEGDDQTSFTMMWGDAGTAQLWISNDKPYTFYLIWQCC